MNPESTMQACEREARGFSDPMPSKESPLKAFEKRIYQARDRVMESAERIEANITRMIGNVPEGKNALGRGDAPEPDHEYAHIERALENLIDATNRLGDVASRSNDL